MLGGQQWIANVVAPPSFAVWPTWDAACQQHHYCWGSIMLSNFDFNTGISKMDP